MQDDERCCGTGTCIIDPQGRCWCGQRWDGEKMCHPTPDAVPAASLEPQAPSARKQRSADQYTVPPDFGDHGATFK